MIIIGDVHGHWPAYQMLLDRFPDQLSIQVGDFGLLPSNKPPYIPKNAYFIRGNHDDRKLAIQYANYLGDYGCSYNLIPSKKVFWVSGAWSIDQARRTEGIDWFRDEELSIADLNEAINLYDVERPDIVITHDCPTEIGEALLNRYHIPGTVARPKHKTRTDQALQAMFEIHQPEHWCFGHYHTNWQTNVNGTKFNCINELSFLEI
jgi:hypothetical protein